MKAASRKRPTKLKGPLSRQGSNCRWFCDARTEEATMKVSQLITLLAILCAANFCQAQSMFRGDAVHSGSYSGPAPRQFHRVKWKFATGDRIVSSPAIKGKAIYFGGDDGNVYAVDAESG